MAAGQHAERLSIGIDSLLAKLRAGPISDKQELKRTLVVLSRLVDCAVASAQLPSSSLSILQLFRLIWLHRDDVGLQPALMVLLISVKSACKAGWFETSDSDELLANFESFSWNFSGRRNSVLSATCLATTDVEDCLQFIEEMSRRYFPWLKARSVVISVTIKPGYEVLLVDFNVTQPQSGQERLLLFVCQNDMETSSCLISPSRVKWLENRDLFHVELPLPKDVRTSFVSTRDRLAHSINHISILLNGKAVDKRTTINVDSGPQAPNDVTLLLRVGANILQVVGEFTDSYTISVAVVTTIDFNTSLKLQEYIVPSCPAEPDDDVIEGPSRVSLRCPISHKRISKPVKGASCKHHQCFDYYSFIEINQKRPAWRCPYCGTPVNFPDLRLDVRMAKVVEEADVSVDDIMILPTGSWEPATSHEIDGSSQIMDASSLVAETIFSRIDADSSVIDLSIENSSLDLLLVEANDTGQVGPMNTCLAPGDAGSVDDFSDRKPDQWSMAVSFDSPSPGSPVLRQLCPIFVGNDSATGGVGLVSLDTTLPSISVTGRRALAAQEAVHVGWDEHAVPPCMGRLHVAGDYVSSRDTISHDLDGIFPLWSGSMEAGLPHEINSNRQGVGIVGVPGSHYPAASFHPQICTDTAESLVNPDIRGRATVSCFVSNGYVSSS